YDNLVLYQTPSFRGFQFGVGYSFSADDGNADGSTKADPTRVGFRTADNVRAITTGLRYVNGPLNVALSFDQLNASHNQAQSQVDATPRSYMIGGSYDFEVVKLALAYARTTDGWFATSNPAGASGSYTPPGATRALNYFKANSYMLGATLPLDGMSNLFGSWQHVSPSNDKLTGDDANMNVWSVGYTYDLSKRTMVYAYGSYGKNYAFIDGLKTTAVGVGLRHRF
ncbi:porin, partial [Piscirickettsia salmonis]|uniref:porin n=1 Tax=Piscirickettsia salmonis TaxID=1238 RepID=UPI000BFAEBC6